MGQVNRKPVRAEAGQTETGRTQGAQPDHVSNPEQTEGAPVRPVRRDADSERRKLDARASGEDVARIEPDFDEPRYFIPMNWYWMAAFIAFAVGLAALVSFSVPPVKTLASTAAAIGLASLGGFFARVERREGASLTMRLMLVVVAVAAPIFLAGLVFANWIAEGVLAWPWAMATMVCMIAITIALLNGRFVSLFAAIMSCWAAVVATDFSPQGLAALAISLIVVGLIGHFHIRSTTKDFELEQLRERIRNRAEDILRDYEETGQGWFWETDRRGSLTYLTKGVATTLGSETSKLLGRPVTELFDLGENNREGERTINFHLSARSSFAELAVRAASSRDERWWSISGRPIYDNFQNFVGFRGSGTDLTEKRRSQQQASRLALYDSLTGLANRHHMSQSLEKILKSPQQRERECAVMLLDLDRFKNVNDTLGHPAGDALLKQVAQRLERAVGKLGRVGRLGGDEFQVLTPGRLSTEKLGQLAYEIIHSLSQPYSIEGQRVVIGASVGVAISPDNGMTSEEIIRNADLALYAAKDGGRGRYEFYSENLHSAAEERNQLEQDLRDAISNGDLELHYQPVIALENDKITGLEALLRWEHPVHGWLSPEKFVPIAEEAGLITTIGEWAIRMACHDLAKWPEEVRCAVNVSPTQFSNAGLPNIITNAIAQAGISPSRLELEITESVFLSQDSNTERMFSALKAVGVRLALDDFGTGYSSLGYLKQAPFDKIKIDQSFMRGATQPGNRNGAIIASITNLANSLEMDTTAEGVETLDELALVRELGCSHVQGYVFYKPMNAQAISERFAQGLDAVASGPKSARPPRQKMLRKVMLHCSGHYYNGTIRNMSQFGCMIEGLWNVPVGTVFDIALSENDVVQGEARWNDEDRMGIKFAEPLKQDAAGNIIAIAGPAVGDQKRSILRDAEG